MKKILKTNLELLSGEFKSNLEKDICELNYANFYRDISERKQEREETNHILI